LFGLISHLALSLKCKVIVILNSDVFVEKEAEIFRNVKEKTINKFFYYEPTIEELFFSIADNKKYHTLTVHKKDILNAIIETEELNARVYIQVLDNCLEWNKEQNLDENITRTLVLTTINFILNHVILSYRAVDENIEYLILDIPNIADHQGFIGDDSTVWSMYDNLDDWKERIFKEQNLSMEGKQFSLTWMNSNKNTIETVWKYGYNLHYVTDVDKETYNQIAQFVRTGILL